MKSTAYELAMCPEGPILHGHGQQPGGIPSQHPPTNIIISKSPPPDNIPERSPALLFFFQGYKSAPKIIDTAGGERVGF